MESALDMSMPWWHFVWRGVAAYLAVLVLLRLAGRRSFGDMSPFDIIVLIIVGGVLRTAILGSDASFVGPMIAVASIIGANRLIGWLSAHWPAFNRFVEGYPAVLARDGKRDRKALRKYGVSDSEFNRELHAHGLEDEREVAIARLEPNGKITLIRHRV
jgi:uncharacterized membrane protein YcaP (DUF421 family)